MIAPLYAAGLLLCLAGAFASKNDTICPPELNFNGVNPIKEARKAGNITVVALLDANCGYCLLQASLLKRLKKKLKKLKKITYVIINKKSARGKKYLFGKDHGIQVYESEQEDSWKKLKGSKDDFIIYDKCGQLASYVYHPLSYLGWPYVRRTILSAYVHPCKNQCPREQLENKDSLKPK